VRMAGGSSQRLRTSVALGVMLLAGALLLNGGLGLQALHFTPVPRNIKVSLPGLPPLTGPSVSTAAVTVYVPPTSGTGSRTLGTVVPTRRVNVVLLACIGPGRLSVAVGHTLFHIACQAILYENTVPRTLDNLPVRVVANHRQAWVLAMYGAAHSAQLP
jgi:hypothetical protein